MGLPCFSFILQRIKKSGSSYDDSKISEITQQEINSKIEEIKKGIKEDNLRDEDIKEMLLVLWGIINKWLTVDPRKRPSLKEFSIGAQES